MRSVLFLLLSIIPLSGPSPRTQPSEPLGWLAGCWHLERGSTIIDEQWMSPLGGMMLGSGRTVKDGAVVEYEFTIIRVTPGGATYEAHPSGQETATFTSGAPPVADQIVFENPTHDFPQRVGYRRVTPDSVVAWIEGNTDRGPRRVEFPYARASCSPR
jgi:Domain of unknown function (DUF6265)